jgi:hypothetical protein
MSPHESSLSKLLLLLLLLPVGRHSLLPFNTCNSS